MSGTDTKVADDPGYEPLAVEDRYPPAAATPDPDSDKGWFRRLLPLLIARRLTFGATLVCGIAGLTLQVSVPMVLRRAIDVARDQRTGSLEAHVWTLVAIAGAAFGHIALDIGEDGGEIGDVAGAGIFGGKIG